MYEEKYKCDKCKKSFGKYKSLSRHMSVIHDISSDQFYVDYYLNGVWPLCKCNCNQKVKWSWQLKGFRDYHQGHQARIKNNWGNNPVCLEKSLATRRKRFASGEITTWNNGLTAETDERVAGYGKGVSEAFTNDRRQEYRKRFNRLRDEGKIVPLHGPQHSQWKGGVSEINVLARARAKLYKEWKYPILVRDGFKCIKCGKTQKLHVHHDKESMSEIIAKHIVDGIKPKTFEEKEVITDLVVDYHINNKVSGVTLCGECHNNLHPSLNFR